MRFPELIRTTTHETLPLIVICVGVCAVLLALSLPTAAAIVLTPALALAGRDLVIAARNRRIRRAWAASYSPVVRPRELLAIVQDEPSRYRLHVRYYGGFGAVRLRPACLLEDVGTGTLSAVHPASLRALSDARDLGVEVRVCE